LLVAQPEQISAHQSSPNTNQYRIVSPERLMSFDPSSSVAGRIFATETRSKCCRARSRVSGQLGFKFSNGSDNHFGIFTGGTIIGAQITARFLWFYPGQYQRPSALGARRPEIVDELKIQRVHGTAKATPLPME
jgi:hypothetical protein